MVTDLLGQALVISLTGVWHAKVMAIVPDPILVCFVHLSTVDVACLRLGL